MTWSPPAICAPAATWNMSCLTPESSTAIATSMFSWSTQSRPRRTFLSRSACAIAGLGRNDSCLANPLVPQHLGLVARNTQAVLETDDGEEWLTSSRCITHTAGRPLFVLRGLRPAAVHGK